MLPHPSLEHPANRNTIDRVAAARAAAPMKPLQEAAAGLAERRPGVDVSWNARTGAPALIQGRLTPRMTGSPSQIAGAALATLAGTVGVAEDLSNAVEVDAFEWGGFQHVRYQQIHNGEPVFGSELVVGINPNDEVRLIASDFDPAVTVTSEEAGISKKEAAQIALQDLAQNGHEPQVNGRISSQVVLYPTVQGHSRCYHLLIPTAEPLGAWRYFVDVASGAIVDSYNSLCFYHAGRADVYLQNPDDTPLITGMLRNLKSPYTALDGTYVKVLNEDGPEAVGAGLSFKYNPANTHFDEANVYHAADAVYDYYRGLGFRGFTLNNPYGKTTVPKGQIRANVHVGVNFDNAFYSPSTGEISFGDGSYPGNPGGLRDLSKESDVVFHEFTHAVLDELRPGIGGIDGAALHEAYADYFACSFTNPPEPQVGEYVVPGPGMIRNLNNANKYPGAPSEPHARGLVWGGACWSLRNKVGGEVADYLIFGSMLLITSTAPTFKYAKDRLLAIDATYTGSEYKPVIKDIFEVQRGIPV